MPEQLRTVSVEDLMQTLDSILKLADKAYAETQNPPVRKVLLRIKWEAAEALERGEW